MLRSVATFDVGDLCETHVRYCSHDVLTLTARSRCLDAVQSSCFALSIVKQGDLMVVANVGDSWVVLGTAFDDDVITSSIS
uniref:protein-serine/threonine phosphatase n=1 Tax=Zea mays TaxID=4577 RepID=A0A804Q5R7_MAIZE